MSAVVILILLALLAILVVLGRYFEHRAKWEDNSAAHFHSLGHGVTFPCTDERCPEGRKGR